MIVVMKSCCSTLASFCSEVLLSGPKSDGHHIDPADEIAAPLPQCHAQDGRGRIPDPMRCSSGRRCCPRPCRAGRHPQYHPAAPGADHPAAGHRSGRVCRAPRTAGQGPAVVAHRGDLPGVRPQFRRLRRGRNRRPVRRARPPGPSGRPRGRCHVVQPLVSVATRRRRVRRRRLPRHRSAVRHPGRRRAADSGRRGARYRNDRGHRAEPRLRGPRLVRAGVGRRAGIGCPPTLLVQTRSRAAAARRRRTTG